MRNREQLRGVPVVLAVARVPALSAVGGAGTVVGGVVVRRRRREFVRITVIVEGEESALPVLAQRTRLSLCCSRWWRCSALENGSNI
jgi:hypothetical protein